MKGSSVVAERELFGILRVPQTLWILVGITLIFAVTVLLKWPSSAVSDLDGAQASQVFRWLAYAMLTSVVLVVPAFPATGLIREVRRRTMELLLNSPLMRIEIITGKMIALLAFALILLLVTGPAMSCCYAMGGISLTNDIATLYAVLLVLCLQLTVLGLLIGTYARTPEAGLRWVYGATFGLVVVTIIPHLFLQGGEGTLAYFASLLRQLSPIPALQQIVGQTSVGSLGLVDNTNYVTRYVWLTLTTCAVGAVVTVQRMNYSLMDRSRSQGIITDDRSRGQRAARRVFFLIDPQKRKSGIPWYLNPVMVKEFRSRQFGRLHWLLRLISACAVLSLLLTFATTMGTVDWGVERIGGIIIVAQAGLIVLLTPGLTGGIIAGEIETGGWDLLRTTPLRAQRILRGKLISVGLTLLLILCATLPGYAIMMLIKPVLREQVSQVLISLVLTSVVCLCISAVVSSFCKTTASATTISYAFLVTLLVGTMLVWMNRDAPFSQSFVESTLTLNPMAAALNAMKVEGFESYNLIPRAWWCSGISCVILLIVLQLQTWRLCRAD